jgi:hypothetical protein
MADSIRQIDAPSRSELPLTLEEWLRELGGPVLLRVPGRDPTRVRAVATLLHGNEPSGPRAVHAWLRSGAEPAVDMLIFLGAVDTALAEPTMSFRFLPGQRDLNRCFRPPFTGPEGVVAAELLERLRDACPEALVDIHNNSGHNPAYGVGLRAGAVELTLAGLFSRRYVQSDLMLGALVEGTAHDFPSITVECGRSGDPAADAVARAGLEAFGGREQLEVDRLPEGIELFVDPMRVGLRPGLRLAFGDGPAPGADLTMSADVDRHNFDALPPGTPIGWLGESGTWPLLTMATDGGEHSTELFVQRNGKLETRREIVPIMMTTSPAAALADCLFYVVQPVGP